MKINVQFNRSTECIISFYLNCDELHQKKTRQMVFTSLFPDWRQNKLTWNQQIKIRHKLDKQTIKPKSRNVRLFLCVNHLFHFSKAINSKCTVFVCMVNQVEIVIKMLEGMYKCMYVWLLLLCLRLGSYKKTLQTTISATIFYFIRLIQF